MYCDINSVIIIRYYILLYILYTIYTIYYMLTIYIYLYILYAYNFIWKNETFCASS